MSADPDQPAAGRLVQALFGLMFVAWLAVAVVAALSLSGAAAALVTVVIIAAGAAIGWSVRRRTLGRAAERIVPD
ncbi:MAG: hypothetical protein J7513_16660 [Solirubrobacteraceae bacterium]|nr:hypothetical protein [Solirubrobacteraceae bacterium]